ncbi:MAG: hypothetical protein Q8Q73_14625 [Stagnimonas sp.]|nr:hypothetical protein [Stagnimonas sp.]
MKRLLLAASLAAVASVAMSAPQPFTYNDLVRFERVSDPVAAPDGQRLAYTLRRTDYEANKGLRSVWLLEVGNGSSRQLTSGAGSSDSPQWGANGDLYFLSTRSGSSQVWRLSSGGGEAQQVTALPLDVGAYKLSPAGDRLVVALEVFPDAKNLAESKAHFDVLEKSLSAGTVYDQLFIRHWDTWKNGSRSQLFALALDNGKAGGEPLLLTKGLDGDAPTKPFGGAEELAFSPDGKTLYFNLRTAGRSEAWSTNVDVWQVSVDGRGKPKNLTADNAATDTGPAPSPDGKTLAWRAMSRPGFEADRYRILLRDLTSGQTRELAADWDRSADTLVWSKDGKTLYTKADDLGQNKLFAIEVVSGKVTALTGPGTVEAFTLSARGPVVAHNTLDRPTDLKLVDASGLKPLTNHNSVALSNLKFGAYEQFSFKGWNDETVYGHVVKPANYKKGRKYPVAFIVHGGPQGSMGNHFH